MSYKDTLEQEYLNKSNIPKLYLSNASITPAKCDLEAYKKLENIKNKIDIFVNGGYNLYIYSQTTGNGKTTWSTILGKSYIKNYARNYMIDCPVYFVNIPEFLHYKKSAISNHSFKELVKEMEHNIVNANLVIWDDLTNTLTDYDVDQLYFLVNSRISNKKSNIVTSNILPNGIGELSINARIYSRLIKDSIKVGFQGIDRRGQKDIF